MIYYISDLHLGHANIINMCDRPFKDVEEMNKTLIDNWNKKVTNNDIVYFLGDFAYKCNQNKATELLKQLNGKKYFIKGNHDKETWLNRIKEMNLIEDWYDYKEIVDDSKRVILCHYPLHSWNGIYRNSIHLYGHVHNKTVPNQDWQKFRYNASCEILNYRPANLYEIMQANIIDSIKEK